MIDIIKNYPFRFYLWNAFRKVPESHAVISLRGVEKLEALHSTEGTFRYDPDLRSSHGAVLPYALPNPEEGMQPFGRGTRFHFLMDVPETVVRLISLDSLEIQTPQQLFETPIRTLLPTMENADDFVWEFLALDFSSLSESLPASLLLVGIPAKLRDWGEQWSHAMEGTAAGFEPGLLAVLRWCVHRTNHFLLLPGSQQSRLAIFDEGKLLLLERLPDFQTLFDAPEKLVNTITEFGQNLELETTSLEIFRGEIPLLKAKEFVTRIGLQTTLLDAPESDQSQIEMESGRIPADASVMMESLRSQTGLFVSNAHLQTTLYRTHPCYRGIFYILAALAVIQVGALGMAFYQEAVSGKLAFASRQIEAEATKIEAEEAKLAPLIQRIRSVSEWGILLRQKEPVSRLLARIESSTPSDVCLQSVAIANEASDARIPDRLKATVRGWLKGGTNLDTAFLEKLRVALPNFAITGKVEKENPLEGAVTPFRLELIQK